MSLTVSSAATNPELTLVGTVKAELGITSSTGDAVMTGMIQRASDYIERWTGRRFPRETVVETLAASGRPYLVLSRAPVVSITAITRDGSTISSTSYDIDNANAGILWREQGWTDTGLLGQNIEGYRTGHGRRDWSVTYVAGYITPGSTAGNPTLPGDVEQACIAIVKAWWRERKENPNVVKQAVGAAAETKAFGLDQVGIPPVATSLLKRWQRIDI